MQRKNKYKLITLIVIALLTVVSITAAINVEQDRKANMERDNINTTMKGDD